MEKEFLNELDKTISFLRKKHWNPISRTEFINQAIREKLERKEFFTWGKRIIYDVEKNIFEWEKK